MAKEGSILRQCRLRKTGFILAPVSAMHRMLNW